LNNDPCAAPAIQRRIERLKHESQILNLYYHHGVAHYSTEVAKIDLSEARSYLLLVDYTGRLYRNGKARMNSAVKEVFDRLDTSQEYWDDMVGRMLKSRDLRGSFFASTSDSIRQVAAGRGKRAANLSPQASWVNSILNTPQNRSPLRGIQRKPPRSSNSLHGCQPKSPSWSKLTPTDTSPSCENYFRLLLLNACPFEDLLEDRGSACNGLLFPHLLRAACVTAKLQ
jgi:hypothetical protein